MNTTSWLPIAAGREFTQPMVHLLVDPCRDAGTGTIHIQHPLTAAAAASYVFTAAAPIHSEGNLRTANFLLEQCHLTKPAVVSNLQTYEVQICQES